jgi:hypothetical protein
LELASVVLPRFDKTDSMPPVRPQVLNDIFQQAADKARQKLPDLTHNQQVCVCAAACRLVKDPSASKREISHFFDFLIGSAFVPKWLKGFEQLGY